MDFVWGPLKNTWSLGRRWLGAPARLLSLDIYLKDCVKQSVKLKELSLDKDKTSIILRSDFQALPEEGSLQ